MLRICSRLQPQPSPSTLDRGTVKKRRSPAQHARWGVVLLFTASLVWGESFGVADSVVGICEVRKAGQTNWQKLRQGTKLTNNDLVRVGRKSLARVRWANGSAAFIRANSQMLINTYENSKAKSASQHFTVFWGAVFFLVKNSVPQEFFGKQDTKVYTPTTVIAIRGTSFEVVVKPETGHTTVGVVNGTVLVRNIIRKVSTFLKAGFKTTVAMNSDPGKPQPYVDKEIEGLKKWVPEDVIISEMNLQLEKAQAAHEAITAPTRDKVVVLPFTNESEYDGAWDIKRVFADYIAENVGKNQKVVKIEVAGTSREDPLQVGNREKAQYVVKGAIQEFDIIQRAKITAQADQYLEFSTARVKLRLQLIDMIENKLVFDNVYTGEVSGENIPKNGWPVIAKLSFTPDNKKFQSSLLGQAVAQAVEQYGESLGRYLRGEL